jgi:hypothetical protein
VIADYVNAGPSAYNGASLTQAHMAGPDHMRTDINGSTPWTSKLFRTGLDRWLSGSNKDPLKIIGSQAHPLTVNKFKYALIRDIESYRPFGVSTLEQVGQTTPRYNGHPEGDAIGHWITARGYGDYLNRSYFDDPATTVWANVAPRFDRDTAYFTNTFVQPHGIVA